MTKREDVTVKKTPVTSFFHFGAMTVSRTLTKPR